MSSFTVFLEVVCHVGSSQELATNFAGDFVLVAREVWAEAISCGKRGITNLKDINNQVNTSHIRRHIRSHWAGLAYWAYLALVGSLCCVYLFDMSIQVVWSGRKRGKFEVSVSSCMPFLSFILNCLEIWIFILKYFPGSLIMQDLSAIFLLVHHSLNGHTDFMI